MTRPLAPLVAALLAALAPPGIGHAAPAAAPASAPAAPAPARDPAPAVAPASAPAVASASAPASAPAASQPAGPVTYRTRAGTVLVEEDGPPRLSLPTESDRAAWRRPGFRFSLGLGFGELFGVGGAPNGRLLGPFVRFAVRLDPQWSLGGTLQFHYASKGVSGLQYSGTVEPTWHATSRLSLALGVGFGGIVETSTSRTDPAPLPSTLDTSYTFPSAHTPIPSCTGVGVAGLLRGEYLFVIGPRASTGLAAEFDAQWTGCVDDTGRVEPDTGRGIVRRQWWPHFGLTVSWVMAWR